ncbi:UDP-N-acetylglucosamine 2-epimerase [Pajaroellobacter abortibovis]|uniref:UDP-N-acetylglucosamine 2-epimerase n=1 Tax=Pajaroellobacter abortibovis TaxID=1882918 RepID=UPI0009FA9FD4
MSLQIRGGLQEEACSLHVPCLILRSTTERPEAVEAKANILYTGDDPEELKHAMAEVHHRPRGWLDPLGDGRTASRVAEISSEQLK